MAEYEAARALVANAKSLFNGMSMPLDTMIDGFANALPTIKSIVDGATAYNEAAAMCASVPAVNVHDAVISVAGKQIDDLISECDDAAAAIAVIRANLTDYRGTEKHPDLTCQYVWKNSNAGVTIKFTWSNELGRYCVPMGSSTTALIKRAHVDIMFGIGTYTGIMRLIDIEYDPKTGKPTRASCWTHDRSTAPVLDGTITKFVPNK